MTVTELVPAEAPAPRWRPTRAGILNVWRYYDEVFEFHKGRLLLRGPNGSGKSKVLELLLPYLLDASLKPSRLSTFGGSERTMHWNLMGDGHTGKTRVGYVWLEFADGPRRFTCGARLQATTNTKNVTVAYFTTERRIGVPSGLTLTGDGGQPLTRAHLIEAIGQNGQVHESADAYRTTVRRTLYSGLTEQRYDSLLTALRQLRTPKLSERLDPGLLSDLLSSALPPLGEGEIHEIAEGFERLDRQREELRRLDGHVQEADRLANRQRTYAQRVLRAASARVISATSAMDGLTAKARTGKENHEKVCAERDTTVASLEKETERGRALGARIDGLKESDAYRKGRELADLRERARRAGQAAANARKTADRHTEDAARRRKEAGDARSDAATQRSLTGQARADTWRAAERAGLTAVHEEAAAAVEAGGMDGVQRARGLLRAAVASREGQIGKLRAALRDHRAAVERRAEAEADRDESSTRLDEAIAERDAAATAYEGRLNALAVKIETWARSCAQLSSLDADALVGSVEDERECDELILEARMRAMDAFAAEEAVLRTRRDALTERAAERKRRRDDLARKKALEPDAPGTRPADRTGRPGGPLWRLVAFAGDIAPDVQAGVEAALQAAGLLDVWVMPDGGLLREEHDAFAAILIARPAPGASLAGVLAPEPGTGVPPEVLRAVLSGIAVAGNALETDHPAVIGIDGSWRLGTVTGRWAKPEPAYIGATAQERARQRRIAELDEEIAGLEGEQAACEEEFARVQAARGVLDAELGDRPPHRPLIEAADLLDAARRKTGQRGDELERDVKRLRDREAAVSTALRALTALGAEHGLPVSEPALDALADAVRDVRENGNVWVQHCEALLSAESRAASAEGVAADYEATAAESADRAREESEAASELAEKVTAIDASLGAEHREVLENLRAAREEAEQCRLRGESLRKELIKLEKSIGGLEEAVRTAEEVRDEAVAGRDRAAARFRHLVAGHLPDDAGVGVTLAAEDGVKATLECARAVGTSLEKTPHEPKNVRDAEARLSEAMHHARDVLADQADLELVQDDDVQVLTATMNGVRVGAAELSAALREERDQRRRDITDKERDLFDRTLAGDTRRHLADRIRQATDLVDGMNRRLERVRTASRVAVRLVWQVDPQQSAGIRAARDLLLRDPTGLNDEDREALYRFFRDRVEEARAANTAASWEEQLMEVLDYTAWHRFTVRLERGDGKGWQDLTRKLHGALSGGEKAIALHLPLFAAVAAHYQTDPGCPRFILLDEVFVGVDTANRGQVFDLLVNLELDLVLTSDHEWCDYRELDGIAIHQLITGDGDDAVTTARFVWDGHRTEAADEEALI
ncbi:TIGR02680 family protein [Actinomadura sp. 7K507]|uniref:TIGR02680 family protein n=1 Tax=Actinomadura sp. 7K507 TaxID=2530365 RepID=UPI0010495AE1|nr:TIGR02680 family protein [Actinomadura sp. 7K507]TDC96969.1 TIGR02680 family protein [Actinomadura sp. 7K507]